MPTETPSTATAEAPLVKLYPTKTRISLLRLVADGQIYEPTWNPQTFRGVDGGTYTERVKELRRAGWIELVPATRDSGVRLRQAVPTTLGRGVLAEHADGGR
jgi:hypothetical protein